MHMTVGRMEKVRMPSWKPKCHQKTCYLWTTSPCSLNSWPSDFVAFKSLFSGSGFISCFITLYPGFGSITDLELYNSCACWHQTSGESTATLPTAKMPTAAAEIPVVMDGTPSIAEKKICNPHNIFAGVSPYPHRNKGIKLKMKMSSEVQASWPLWICLGITFKF